MGVVGLAFALAAAFLVTLGAVLVFRRSVGRYATRTSLTCGGQSGGGRYFVAFLVLAYLALNTALSVLNRVALGMSSFRFPVFVTATHMALGSTALAPSVVGATDDDLCSIFVSEWKGLLLVSALNGLQIAANNASLTEIGLSMNQVVRACVPVLTAGVAALAGSRLPSAPEAASLFAVSLGVALCVYESGRHSAYGIALVATSALVQAAQMSLASVLMTRRLTPQQMTFFTGPIAFLLLVPASVAMGEEPTLSAALRERPATVLGFLLGGSGLAVAYNVVFNQCLRRLSAVGTAVLANAKIALVLLLSASILGELSSWTRTQAGGCALTLAGTLCYSLQRQRAATTAPSSRHRSLGHEDGVKHE